MFQSTYKCANATEVTLAKFDSKWKTFKRKIVNFAFCSLVFYTHKWAHSTFRRRMKGILLSHEKKTQCHVSIFNTLFFFILHHSFVIHRERENVFRRIFIWKFAWISRGRNALLMTVSVPSARGVLDARSLFRIGLLCKKSTCTKVLCILRVNWKRKKEQEGWRRREWCTFKRDCSVLLLFSSLSRFLSICTCIWCFCCSEALNTSRQTSESNAPQF